MTNRSHATPTRPWIWATACHTSTGSEIVQAMSHVIGRLEGAQLHPGGTEPTPHTGAPAHPPSDPAEIQLATGTSCIVAVLPNQACVEALTQTDSLNHRLMQAIEHLHHTGSLMPHQRQTAPGSTPQPNTDRRANQLSEAFDAWRTPRVDAGPRVEWAAIALDTFNPAGDHMLRGLIEHRCRTHVRTFPEQHEITANGLDTPYIVIECDAGDLPAVRERAAIAGVLRAQIIAIAAEVHAGRPAITTAAVRPFSDNGNPQLIVAVTADGWPSDEPGQGSLIADAAKAALTHATHTRWIHAEGMSPDAHPLTISFLHPKYRQRTPWTCFAGVVDHPDTIERWNNGDAILAQIELEIARIATGHPDPLTSARARLVHHALTGGFPQTH